MSFDKLFNLVTKQLEYESEDSDSTVEFNPMDDSIDLNIQGFNAGGVNGEEFYKLVKFLDSVLEDMKQKFPELFPKTTRGG